MLTPDQFIRSGSNPGAFFLGRHGLYVEEVDAWIIFIVFKGNDLHGGVAPVPMGGPDAPRQDSYSIPSFTLNGELIPEEHIQATWRLAGPQNRVFFVLYNSMAATWRFASLSVTPALHFGNQGANVPHKSKNQTYSSDAGSIILGGREGQARCLAVEAAKSFLNFMRECNLKSTLDLNDILGSMSYDPGDGGSYLPIASTQLDIVRDAKEIAEKRAAVAYYRQQCEKFYIRGTKSERANSMAWLKVESMDYKSFPLTERRQYSAYKQKVSFPAAPQYLINRVEGRSVTSRGVCLSPSYLVLYG